MMLMLVFFFSSIRRNTRCALVTGVQTCALPIWIALPLVSWLGFDPKASNSAEALDGLLLVFAIGPAVAHSLSAALIARFPLDEAAHSEIRDRKSTRLNSSH